MDNMEVVVKIKVSILERMDLNKKVAYLISCFVGSLRGIKGFVMDESGLMYHIGKGREGPLDHVVIPLVGIFKVYTGIIHHLQSVVNYKSPKLNFW